MHCKRILTKTSHNNNTNYKKNTQNNNLGKKEKERKLVIHPNLHSCAKLGRGKHILRKNKGSCGITAETWLVLVYHYTALSYWLN